MNVFTKSLWMLISALSLFLLVAACDGQKAVKADERPAVKQTVVVNPVSLTFTATNVAPAMKLFGTGQNYRGALNKIRSSEGPVLSGVEGWQSPGLSPHYLLLDGSGAFEGLVIQAVENATALTVYLKRGGEYVAKYSLTNTTPVVTNKDGTLAPRGSWKAQLKFNPNASGTNALALADRVKLEFEGTNVAVAGLELYGVLTNTIFAGKKYERNKQENELNKKSAQEFNAKRFDGAIKINEELLRLNPENPYPYMNLGQIYQGIAEKSEENGTFLETMRQSLELYDAANRVDNSERKSLLTRMSSIARNNLLDPQTALQYDLQLLSTIKAESKDPEEAVRAIANIAVNPQTPRDTSMKMMQEVVAWVKTNSVDTNDGGMAFKLGRYSGDLLYTKDYTGTIDVERTIIAKYPNTEFVQNGGSYMTLAVANMALSRWQEAIEAWKGYYNSNPTEQGVYCIAYCYLKMNNSEKAYQNYVIAKLWEDNAKLYEQYSSKLNPIFDPLYKKYKVIVNGKYISNSEKYLADFEGIVQIIGIVSGSLNKEKMKSDLENYVQSILKKYALIEE